MWLKTIADTVEKQALVDAGYVSYIVGNGFIYYYSSRKNKVKRYDASHHYVSELSSLSKPNGTTDEVLKVLERWFAIEAGKKSKVS